MNLTTLAVSFLPICFGLVTLAVRWRDPDSKLLGKYRAMQERWGTTAGTAMHVIAYTVVPILVGLGMAGAALNGVSLGQLVAP